MRVCALALTAACAAGQYEARPRPSLTSVSEHGEGSFTGAEGVKLFEQWWRPAEVKAVMVIVHGLKDHSTRYAEFADLLARRGYAVRAFDLRGHGSSEGRRVYIDSFDEYVADLETFIASVQKREPGKPIFLFGHSMGGAIVTKFTLDKRPALAGLILSGPALHADVSGFTKVSTKFVAFLAPRLAVFSLDLDKFSRDPKAVQECKADPLVDPGNGPARTAARLLGAMDEIGEHMEEVTVPLLAMHGGADVITDPEGTRELVRRAKSADKTLKIYDGLYHDLLHEPEKAQVMADIAAWMDARVR